jgi:D-sedoheptulose 7-phosphate isomerase
MTGATWNASFPDGLLSSVKEAYKFQMLYEDVISANRVYLCGNGGSAANAVHIANDLISCGIKAHAITADVATLTAIANDFGYEHIFSKQIEVFGEPKDLLIVLSGSGNSKNVLNAIETAKRIGMNTWAIVGGGKAAEIADHCLMTKSDMQSSEERQIEVGHKLMKTILCK